MKRNTPTRVGLLVATGLAATLATSALGCVIEPMEPPLTYWKQYHGLDPTGRDVWWVGQEVTPFAPLASTTCVCGLNLALPPLPPGAVNLVDAGLFIVNRDTHAMRELTDPAGNAVFDFTPNAVTTSGLNQQSPGGTWFGFSSPVNPFQVPALPPNEFFKLLFLVSIDSNLVPFQNVIGRTGSGEGFAGGVVDPANLHIYAPINPLVCIPSPAGTIALCGLGAVVGGRRRRAAEACPSRP